jgi:hypothetical protein
MKASRAIIENIPDGPGDFPRATRRHGVSAVKPATDAGKRRRRDADGQEQGCDHSTVCE